MDNWPPGTVLFGAPPPAPGTVPHGAPVAVIPGVLPPWQPPPVGGAPGAPGGPPIGGGAPQPGGNGAGPPAGFPGAPAGMPGAPGGNGAGGPGGLLGDCIPADKSVDVYQDTERPADKWTQTHGLPRPTETVTILGVPSTAGAFLGTYASWIEARNAYPEGNFWGAPPCAPGGPSGAPTPAGQPVPPVAPPIPAPPACPPCPDPPPIPATCPGGYWTDASNPTVIKGYTRGQTYQTLVEMCPPPPSPPPSIPPMPDACKGWTFPLGFPRIGSKDWCDAADTILSTLKKMGATLIDWLIQALDSLEKMAWPWANTDVSGPCASAWQGSLGDGGVLASIAALPGAIGNALSCIWGALKWAIGQIGYQVMRGAKALLCMLRSAQGQPGYLDYATYTELWALQYVWKNIKTARLSSPDFLGVQTVGADIEDFFEKIIEFLMKQIAVMEPPGIPEAIEAFLTNRISAVQFACWMTLEGADPGVWQPVIDSRRDQLTTDEYLDERRRRDLPSGVKWHGRDMLSSAEKKQEEDWKTDSIASMRNRGWLYYEDAAPRYSLYDEIPTISDHLHWLARNIDDLSYVKDYHLLDGFDSPEMIRQILGDPNYAVVPQSVTRNFWEEFGTELRTQGMRKIDAMRHYAAHWLHASPGQLATFAHRLREGRTLSAWDQGLVEALMQKGASEKEAIAALTFTPTDFTRILSEQDYSYRDVGWFQSTLYHVPALSYIRDMYRYGIIGEEELAGYHQDLGYNRLDSERFVGVDRSIKARIRTAESFGWTPGSLSRAFGAGQVTADFVKERMTEQGFSDKETTGMLERAQAAQRYRVLMRALGRVVSRTLGQVTASFAAGVLDQSSAEDALGKLGVPQAQARGIVEIERLKVKTKLASELQRTVRTGFLKGKLDEQAARDLLERAHVTKEMIDNLLATWNLELLRTEKEATVAQIRAWVAKGVMTIADAKARLLNLKIPDFDVGLIVEELTLKLANAQAKRDAAEHRNVAAQQKAIAAAAKMAQEAHAQAVRELQKQEPVAKLQKWLELGIITDGYFRHRLQLYGYDDTVIRLLYDEACRRKGAHCAPAPG